MACVSTIYFDASRRGKKVLNYFRDKSEGAYHSEEGEEKPASQ